MFDIIKTRFVLNIIQTFDTKSFVIMNGREVEFVSVKQVFSNIGLDYL